jgi:hypothetical protein
MLPEPVLDNQSYKEILDQAKKSISQIMPLWTDHNAHDPGITLLELFSWLKEMQQFHLDQISDASRMKFLKLLGIRPEPVRPARAYAVFSQEDQNIRMPAGVKLSSHHLVFETTEAHTLTRARVSRLRRTDAGGRTQFDIAPPFEDRGLAWPVFGDDPQPGACLYIGFHLPLPVKTGLSLFFELTCPADIQRNPVTDPSSFVPLDTLAWEYLSDPGGFLPLDAGRDETCGLIQSGQLFFQIPDRMQRDPDGIYWIRCVLKDACFDAPPYLRQVRNNTVPVFQQNTLVSNRTVRLKDGLPARLTLNHWMAVNGRVQIQIQGRNGKWLGPLPCGLNQDLAKQRLVLTIDPGEIPLASDQIQGLRVISCLPEFEPAFRPGAGTGLPLQSFSLSAASIREESFQLQIGSPLGGDRFEFEDWTPVGDWDASSPSDLHYALDSVQGQIHFGDGIHGRIPPKDALIQIISLATCHGKEGNVKNGEINLLVKSLPLPKPIQVYNPAHAAGGQDPESLEDAFLRYRRDALHTDRAITAADYESLTLTTPGLALKRVKAIPLYRPGLLNYPENKAPNCLSIAVLPYNQAIAANISRRLDRRRLITTQIHIIEPEYLPFDIQLEILTHSFASVDTLVTNALARFFDPMTGGARGQGLQIGQGLEYEEVFRFVSGLEWVDQVLLLALHCRGNGMTQNAQGDIRVPPYALPRAGQYRLDVRRL